MSGVAGEMKCRFYLLRPQFYLDVAFECPEQGVTAVVGPSGAGKSTILRCMAGLERESVGDFRSHATVWQSPSTFVAAHRRPFGFVFQRPNLFEHMDVAKNIGYGLLRMGMNAAERVAIVQEMARDLKIDMLLRRNPATLSGGQQQRVALARALVLQPRILLMDEPLSGLDDDLKVDFLDLLDLLQQRLQLSIIYVTHSKWEVSRIADRVIRLDHGKVTDCLSVADYTAAKRSQGMDKERPAPLQHKSSFPSLPAAILSIAVDRPTETAAPDTIVIPVTIRSMTPSPIAPQVELIALELGTDYDTLLFVAHAQHVQSLGIKVGSTVYAAMTKAPPMAETPLPGIPKP